MRILEYDVLVIGAGLAGERAAIEAAQKGANTCILSLVQPRQSHSNCAQGGCQASLDNMGEESAGDNWEVHFNDTIHFHNGGTKRLYLFRI